MRAPHNVIPAINDAASQAHRSVFDGNSLALELLDTSDCIAFLSQVTAFEDFIFGPDFAICNDEMKCWAESGSWFCAAVSGQAVVGRQQIFSLLSVLVTTTESRDRLIAGKITESELQPWTHHPLNDQPALYLASVASAASGHLAPMYESLAHDLSNFSATWETDFSSGFSIASGPAGFSHMARNGFRALDAKYRGHYPMMLIDGSSAATPFWRRLLCRPATDSSCFRSPTVAVPS